MHLAACEGLASNSVSRNLLRAQSAASRVPPKILAYAQGCSGFRLLPILAAWAPRDDVWTHLERSRPSPHPFGVEDDERGAILVVVMLIMVVLLGLGMSGLFLTKSNIQMLTNTNLRNQALYVAEAGLERARDILNGPIAPDLTALLGGTGHVSNPSDEIPSALDSVYGLPIGRGAILTDTAGVSLFRVNYPTSVAHSEAVPGNPQGLTNPLMGIYTVFIRNDMAECRMGKFTVDGLAAGGNQVVVIRSEGTASDGRTTVVLEMTMGGGATNGTSAGAGGIAAVLCNSGKNACDDNNSVQNNVVVNN